jgi:3-oxoacyl-[acyl-carrier protein] reductase
MFAEVPPKAVQVIAARHPLGIGLPESLVGAFAYLASDEARWTTGAAIVVDGGLQPSVNPDVRG